MELFHDIMEAMNNPQTRHAAMVHLPIAMSMIGPVVLFALLVKGKSAGAFRWLAVVFFVVATVSAVMAERSGHAAADASTLDVDIALTDAASDTLIEHREMAERVVWLFASTAVLTLVSMVPLRLLRGATTLLALGLSIFTFAWVAATAHYGGELVYDHGVGVPATENNLPDDTQQEQSPQTMPTTQDRSQDQSPDGPAAPKTDSTTQQQSAQPSAPEAAHRDSVKNGAVKTRRPAPL